MPMRLLTAQLCWLRLSDHDLSEGAALDQIATLLDLLRKRRRWLPDEGDRSLRRRCVIELARRVRAGEVA